MGNKPTDFELLYGDIVILTILNFYLSSNGEFSIDPQKKDKSKDQTMDDYFTKYGVNPFHRNADFDLSIHRTSGKKAGLIQVTVRSNSRIAYYFVETETLVTDSIQFKINQVKVEVEVYQAVLIA